MAGDIVVQTATALIPAFALGFAIQKAIELIDSFFGMFVEPPKPAPNPTPADPAAGGDDAKTNMEKAKEAVGKVVHPSTERQISLKKFIVAGAAWVIGWALARHFQIDIIGILQVKPSTEPEWGYFATGLLVSGGTEFSNSLLKWLEYAKNAAKPEEQPGDGKATKEKEVGEQGPKPEPQSRTRPPGK